MHEKDFKQGDNIEDFGVKKLPKLFESPIFSRFVHQIRTVLQRYYKESIHHICFPVNIDKNFKNICSIEHMWITGFRSNRPEVFSKKGVLGTFAKFTGKHLCQSPFFDKPATLLEKRLRYFSVNFVKFLRAPFFIEYLW